MSGITVPILEVFLHQQSLFSGDPDEAVAFVKQSASCPGDLVSSTSVISPRDSIPRKQHMSIRRRLSSTVVEEWIDECNDSLSVTHMTGIVFCKPYISSMIFFRNTE